MSAAILGYGSFFQTGDGNSPESFTSFAEVSSIGLSGIEADVIDTSHEWPPGSTRRSFAGQVNYGAITIGFNFVPGGASTADLMAELASKPTRSRRIVLPNGAVWLFSGYLTNFESGGAVNDRLTGSATFQVTGGTLQLVSGVFTIGVSEIGGLDAIP